MLSHPSMNLAGQVISPFNRWKNGDVSKGSDVPPVASVSSSSKENWQVLQHPTWMGITLSCNPYTQVPSQETTYLPSAGVILVPLPNYSGSNFHSSVKRTLGWIWQILFWEINTKMSPILHSETHSDFVLFWSFKLILKIILFLFFAFKKLSFAAD